MTSGEFSSFPLSRIWVNRDKRQRKEIKDVEGLAASISSVGLINPIVIKRDGELVAGERRYTAISSLGWTSAPVQFTDELDELSLHLLELEENVQRIDLTWQEECLAVEEYHRLQRERDPEWNASRTAESLHQSAATVSEKLSVAKELLRGNTMVADSGNYSTAKGITKRAEERRANSVKLAIATSNGTRVAPPPDKEFPVLNTDFHTWADNYSGPLFNFLHCDFPYGINADKQQQGHQALSVGSYSDTEDDYKSLLDRLSFNMDNLVAPQAHLMFWFSMDYYSYTKNFLEEMGWAVNPFPLIWHKSDNTGLLPDPNRGPRRIYETCFIASRGDRKIVRAKSNVFAWPGKDKEIHMSEKPVEMLQYFMSMFIDEYTRVLDPTCGSANAIKSAINLGADYAFGIEQNIEFYNRAKEAFHDKKA